MCAVTYESEEDGGVHQYVATYGDRSDGTAYYYVSNAIAGTWVGNGGTLTLCRVSMKKTTPVVLERIMDGDI